MRAGPLGSRKVHGRRLLLNDNDTTLVDRIDDAVGNSLEAAVRRHHRKRLRRLGHEALETEQTPDRWVPVPRPPRADNSVEVLIDGQSAFGAMADAMQAAKSHIHIAGWHLTPALRLRREDGSPTLSGLLRELSENVQVRVLLWAGPPLPMFQPTRRMMKSVQGELTRNSKVRCMLDGRERTLHCHHEKIVLIDDEVAFVGGIDLSDLAGDRWDENSHPPRGSTGWHDVATLLRGPVVTDVAEHFRNRWQEVAAEQLPAPIPQPAAGGVTVQLLRTVPEKTYEFLPRGEFSILDAYLRALKSARHFIYLENQFLWSAEIGAVLADKLRHPPTDDFRLLLVLPARPSNGKDTTRGQLGALLSADDGAGRLLATTINAHSRDRTDSLYVHAKVGIIDDNWLTIGSANLNEHSLFNDTEVNVATQDSELARNTRLRLWAEHLERPIAEIDGPVAEVLDRIWKPTAAEQLARSRTNQPPTHRLTELPGISRRSERLLGPSRGLLVDG